MPLKSHLVNSALSMVVFFSILAILNFCFTRISMRLEVNEPKVIEIMAMRDQDYDILYLGNSITQQGINPETIATETGLQGFNLALGGACITEMEMVLESYLSKNKKPKLLVYGIAINRGPEGPGVRPTVFFSLPRHTRERYLAQEKAQGKDNPWLKLLVSRLPVYRFRQAPERLLKYQIQGQKRVPKWIKGHLALSYPYEEPATTPAHAAGINEKGLEAFLNFCSRQGIKVLLVELPNSASFNASVTQRAETLTRLKAVAVGVPFISYNEDSSLYGKDAWVGINHLSAKGAITFSSRLAADLPALVASSEP